MGYSVVVVYILIIYAMFIDVVEMIMLLHGLHSLM